MIDERKKIALERIKNPAYLTYEGPQKDIALLHSFMERLAKSEYGSKIILGLKKTEDLPKNHQVVIKIQDSVEAGLPYSAAGVHKDNGEIVLFKRGKDENDEQLLKTLTEALIHELCHEEQFQQGLCEYKNFTPEQNFIINRLKELDAANLKKEAFIIKGGFEGTSPFDLLASTLTYNQQALFSSFIHMHEGEISDKSFEDIRKIYVERLGVNIDPEYFSVQTLANSPCGKEFFIDEKLPIQQDTRSMNDGELSVFKHPKGELTIYTDKKRNIEITKKKFPSGRQSICFSNKESSQTIMAIEQFGDVIKKIQTKNNPDECKDLRDFEETLSQMNLPKDVLEEFSFDISKAKNFITSPSKPQFSSIYSSFNFKTKEKESSITPVEQKSESRKELISRLRGISSEGNDEKNTQIQAEQTKSKPILKTQFTIER